MVDRMTDIPNQKTRYGQMVMVTENGHFGLEYILLNWNISLAQIFMHIKFQFLSNFNNELKK